MRWHLVLVMAGLAGCATARSVCPADARLATEDRPTGRVEWCAKTSGGFAQLPARERSFAGLLGMAHPAAMSGGLHGPFTRWYPDGAVESHGRYVDDGSSSVPDGVWGFWHPDGSRKSIGRYERGQPVGCFVVWDERGVRTTGVVEGDQLRVEACDPPADDALTQVESRSSPLARRRSWGDVSIHALPQAGAFGASNATQRDPDPSARLSVQAALRRHLGPVRVGPALGLRLSDSGDAHAYSAGVVSAYAVPLPYRRVGLEVEAQLGVQYLDLTARRMDAPGTSSVGIWSPLLGGRVAVSFALTPALSAVAGVSVDGTLGGDRDRTVRYCAPVCGPAITETWNVGGAAYGADVGLRLTIR